MEPLLTIAVPTYQNPQQLEWCLRSLVLNTDFPYQIVIVNNDGSDPGKQAVDRLLDPERLPYLTARHPGQNLGWMGGINMALEECETMLFCMLNDDVVFLPNNGEFWRTLAARFEDPLVGAVGPCSNFVTGNQNLYEMGRPLITEANYLIGFCMVARTQLLKDLGGMDEKIPGGDDIDLSIRIRKAGYKLISDRTVYLHHIGQQTGIRVKGQEWNSRKMIMATNNALLRRHGVREWYETSFRPAKQYTRSESKVVLEDEWFAEVLEKHSGEKGVNLGSGSKNLPGVLNVDKAEEGEHGAGGRKFDGAHPDLTADAGDLPFEDGSIDFICAAHLLEHMIDPLATLDEWRRVMKDDGWIYLTLPDHDQLNTMIIDYTHLHAYTVSSIRRLLEGRGFRVEETEQMSIGFMKVVAQKIPDELDPVEAYYAEVPEAAGE